MEKRKQHSIKGYKTRKNKAETMRRNEGKEWPQEKKRKFPEKVKKRGRVLMAR